VAGYEKSDVNAIRVLIYSVVGVFILAAILLFLYNYFLAEKEEMVFEEQLKPQSVQLRDLRAHEEEMLTTYKLLDADKGIYRIPIDRAMQLIAEENFRKQLKSN
jgi:hypothetical protein